MHQWESGIVLARYILQNKDQFQGRSVLELGSGSGLVAITAGKYTGITQFVASDCNPAVLRNINDNATRNSCQVRTVNLDWTEASTYLPQKFDYIIGSDLIFDGAPLDALCRTADFHLAPEGSMLLIMPLKRHMTASFVDYMTSHGFAHEATPLQDEYYLAPASPPAIGYRDFPELRTHSYQLHTFHRA